MPLNAVFGGPEMRSPATALTGRPRILAVALLGGPLWAAAPPAPSLQLHHGTLIVPVLTQHTLVTCSDRRRLMPDGSHAAVQKVFPVGSNALYAASGSTAVSIGGAPGRSFDAHAIVQAYFQGKGRLTVEDVVPGLSNALTAAVGKVFGHVEPQTWLRGRRAADPALFRVVVFLAIGGHFDSVDLSIRLDVEVRSLVPKAVELIQKNYTDRLKLIGGSGTPEIAQQLLDPGDVLWADVRSAPLMAKVLLAKESIRASLSVADAERFARGLIRVVSNRKARLGFEDDVSPESDCLFLNDDGTLSHK